MDMHIKSCNLILNNIVLDEIGGEKQMRNM